MILWILALPVCVALGILIGLFLARDLNRYAVFSSVAGLVSLIPISGLGTVTGQNGSLKINLIFIEFFEPNLVFSIGQVEEKTWLLLSLASIGMAGIAANAYIKANDR